MPVEEAAVVAAQAAALRLRVSLHCVKLRASGGLVRSAGNSCSGICGRFITQSGREGAHYNTIIILTLI